MALHSHSKAEAARLRKRRGQATARGARLPVSKKKGAFGKARRKKK